MEWVKRLNESMDYLEEHLTEEIDYEQLGRIACCCICVGTVIPMLLSPFCNAGEMPSCTKFSSFIFFFPFLLYFQIIAFFC